MPQNRYCACLIAQFFVGDGALDVPFFVRNGEVGRPPTMDYRKAVILEVCRKIVTVLSQKQYLNCSYELYELKNLRRNSTEVYIILNYFFALGVRTALPPM